MFHRYVTGYFGFVLWMLITQGSAGAAQDRSSCMPASDWWSGWALVRAKSLVTNPSRQADRTRLKLAAIDTSTIRQVEVDSLCRLAGQTVNVSRQLTAETPRNMILITFGRMYYAADPHGIHGGEWINAFLLDSTLTKVVGETGM